MSKTNYQTAGSREPAKELTLQQLVIDTVESGNRTHMCSLCDCLWMHKDEYAVFGWIELLNNAILRASAVVTITRRDDGSLHLNFRNVAMGRGFNVKKYAAGVAAELRQALSGLVEEVDS